VWREKLKLLDTPSKTRRRFWELFGRKALAAKHRPVEADLAMLLAEAEAGSAAAGSVALVGAGPGDPELLTLKALRAVQSADVVLYDDLVSPAIVNMARREAEKIPVGKRGYKPSCRQDHIVSLLVALASQGKRVVRFKGGDPTIFGRANEEIAALRAARIPIEIIPGVTAALGAAAGLQISLTAREKARRLQFITAHAHDGKLPGDIDWRALCDPRASTVVYMGVKTLELLAGRRRSWSSARPARTNAIFLGQSKISPQRWPAPNHPAHASYLLAKSSRTPCLCRERRSSSKPNHERSLVSTGFAWRRSVQHFRALEFWRRE
jgi:uroporphyrin-III C-methyltransferase/precorrin-2 dehydrogenase/sirohydrochlorin ferrochelatase